MGGDGPGQLRLEPTRRRLSIKGAALFNFSAAALIKRGVQARMSATDTQLGHFMPKAVPAARLPRALFGLLFLFIGMFGTIITPLVASLTFSLTSLVQSEPTQKSGWWNLLVGPAIYYGIMLCGYWGLVAVKWILFPRRMRPGIYPLYGWTYWRWLAFQALWRRVSGFLEPHILGTPAWTLWLRMLGARVGVGTVIYSSAIFEPDLLSIGHGVVVDEDAFVSAAIVAPAGMVDPGGWAGGRVGVTGGCMVKQWGTRRSQGNNVAAAGRCCCCCCCCCRCCGRAPQREP